MIKETHDQKCVQFIFATLDTSQSLCKGKIMLRSLLRMHRRHMPFFLGGGVISIFVPWKHHSGFNKR